MTNDPPSISPLAPLVGHDAIERRLAGAHRRGGLHHAHLFAGPRGVGKFSLALRLAAHVMAGGGQANLDTDPDDKAVRRVAAGSHPDLLVLKPKEDGAKTISIDAVRKATRFLAQTPAEGGWRALIVDAADDMTSDASNTLLKSLEEPGSRSLIVLVGHAPGDLLDTIRSRCLISRFRTLDEAEMREAITRSGQPLDDARMALAAGRPGRYRTLTDADLQAQDTLRRLVADPARLSPVQAHDYAAHITDKDGLAAFMAGWRQWLAGTIRAAALGNKGVPGRLEDWSALWEKTNRAAALADEYNLERRHVVLDALLDLTRVANGRPIKAP